MRYDLESTLPINAFSPRGGRTPFALGMTLEGGGGGIPIVSDVVNAVSDVGQSVANVVSDVGQSVANVVSDAGTTIDNAVIQPAIDDPAGTIIKIGAIAAAPATGGASLYAIPAYTASKALAAGVDIEDVAKMTAISAAATYAGVSVADYVGTLAEFGTDIGSQQTAMLAAQNVGIGTGSAASTTIGQIAGGAASGALVSGATGNDIGTGLISGAVNAGIGAGVGAAVNAGAGLLSGTTSSTGSANTGTNTMDENFYDLGFSDQAAADAAWEQAQAEFDAAGGYAGSYSPEGYGTADGYALGDPTEIANFTGAVAASGLDGGTVTNLIKQYGTQAVKALVSAGGSTLSNAVSSAARRAQLQAQGYTPSQINSMEGATGLLGAGANYFLNQNQLGQLQSTYNQNVAGQQAATQTAQQQAAFTPVGMTTTFGQSNFQYDPTTGKMVSAGYTPSSQVSGLQNALLGQAATTAQQAGQVSGQIAPMQAGAQNLFGLAGEFLPTSAQTPQATAESQSYYNQQQALANAARPSSFATTATPEAQALYNQFKTTASSAMPTSFDATATPEAQALYNRLSGLSNQVLPTSYDTTAAAQKYMQQQQALLNPARQQTLAQLQAKQYGAGTSGLATGGTAAGYATNAQGLLATNPQMAAYYNAMAQQDAQLAASAEQQARTNLQSDITLGTNLGTQGLSALTTSQQQTLQNALSQGQFAQGMGTAGLSALTTSQQQALQNALSQGQFAQTAGGAGLSALTSSQQQQYANMMNNLQAGTNLYGAGAGLLTQGQTLQNTAYAPLSTQVGLLGGIESLSQQPLNLATALGTAGATAGAKSGYYGLLGNQAALQTQLQGNLANIYGQGAALGSAVNPLVSAAGTAIGSWLS